MSDQHSHTANHEGANFDIRLFDGRNALAEIESNWRVLDRESSSHQEFFQSADWCLNWLDCHPHANPLIVTAWQNGKLVMLLPLMQRNSFGAHVLEILTDADAYYAGPVASGDVDLVATFDAILKTLGESGKHDLLRLDSVPEELPICSLAEEPLRMKSGLEYSSIIELSGFDDLDAYLATRSKGSRKSLRRKVKDFEKLGTVEAKTLKVTGQYKETMFPKICHWKRQWFNEYGVLGGDFNRSDMEEQLSALCDTSNQTNPPLATELLLDGKLVACDVMLQRDGILYSYVTARDLAYHKYGIGTVMDLHTIEFAIRNGYRAIDLLSGPNPSKDSLSTKQVPLVNLRFPLTAKGKFQAQLDRLRLRDQLKRIFYKLPISIRQSVIALRNRG